MAAAAFVSAAHRASRCARCTWRRRRQRQALGGNGCVPCHAVGATARREVSDAPPFEAIARKFATHPEMLAFSLLDPHPRMNVALTRREIEDVAAYIDTLAK